MAIKVVSHSDEKGYKLEISGMSEHEIRFLRAALKPHLAPNLKSGFAPIIRAISNILPAKSKVVDNRVKDPEEA